MSLRHEIASAALNRLSEPAAAALDRRRLLGWATGLGATAAAARFGLPTRSVAAAQQDSMMPAPGHTWFLVSPDALRPAAPGDPTDTEIAELVDFQSKRSDATAELVARWGGRRAVLPWLDVGAQLTAAKFPPGLLENRAQALIRTAMHDAVVAALDAQAAHARPAPADADDRLTVLGTAPTAASSFPSLHATVAGAASTVFAYLFPDASSDGFAEMAEEAATSRLWAGAAYRSDVEAGLTLGRAIGDLAVERGRTDGSDAVWDRANWPTGDGVYVPTPPNFVDPPLAPLGGTWATWVLPSGDAIRPAPFPAFGSAAWDAELAAVRAATAHRTAAQERIIDYWLSKGPNGFYTEYAQDLIARAGLGEAETAAALAMISVAIYDALVAVWDAKYHYWVARPLTMDPDLAMYIPNPPYPSYPGGFAAVCGAGASVLAALFPAAEADLLTAAWEGSAQRCWSGIHYVLDDDVGLVMGCRVGRLVADHVRRAGAV